MKSFPRIAPAAAFALALAAPQAALAAGGSTDETTVQGVVEVQHSDDFRANTAKWDYFLRTDAGKLKLHYSAKLPGCAAASESRARPRRRQRAHARRR